MAAQQLSDGSPDGVTIVGSTTEKIALYGGPPVAQGAALTAQVTTITHTAPGTADYALQDLTDSGGFGFKTKDEGNTALAVIANLQTRLAQVEARLEAIGLVAAN